MQTFDQSLYNFYKAGLITYEDALSESTSPNDLALLISGVNSSSEGINQGIGSDAEPEAGRVQPSGRPQQPSSGQASGSGAADAGSLSGGSSSYWTT